jgi:ribose 5-phosphate isomerase B
MKVYIGADHNGFYVRNALIKYLKKAGYDVVDEGDEKLDPGDDFPIYAARVVNAMKQSEDSDPRGIIICGSGQGVCIAANRFKGIRAALGYSRETVREARVDDDVNVLCLAANDTDENMVNVIAETFLSTQFDGAPRFRRRLAQLDEL